MLYNKAAANDSYSWKQEDHQHQFLCTQASYKDPGAILSNEIQEGLGINIMHRTRQMQSNVYTLSLLNDGL